MRSRKSREEIEASQLVSLTELGVLFGDSSHGMGRVLEILGYWIPNKGPTAKAIEGGFIVERPYGLDDKHPLVVWYREKTVAALEEAGWEQRPETP